MKRYYETVKQALSSSIYRMQRLMVLAFIFCMIYTCFAPTKMAKADAYSSVKVQIDYLEEIAKVTAGTGGSTRFYMSSDNKKTWEILDTTGVIDLSSILTSKGVTLWFKGNKDLTATQVDLPPDVTTDNSLKVIYKITGGVGSIEFSGTSLPVEFRKGNNGSWRSASNKMSTGLYEIKGATLYFRTSATALRRAGKVVSVKISKRPAAPSVKLDAGKLCITGLKVGETQYRVGDSNTWITFTSPDTRAKSIDLTSILSVTSSAITPIQAGIVEFRTLGSDKKLNSSVKIIEVPLQPTVPNQITLNGTTLSVVDTNLKRYYEYTVVSGTSILNLNTAKWTSFTSKSPVKVKAAVTDRIYVRVKSYTDATTKQLVLASTYTMFTVTAISQ